jgi:hypothetical protein
LASVFLLFSDSVLQPECFVKEVNPRQEIRSENYKTYF